MGRLNGLDLFSGIAGNTIGLRDYVKTIAYCEADRHAQSVLLSRMASDDVERAPIWDDITSLRGSMLPKIDIIIGGFPCQDISVAGTGKGLAGERSGLFFEVVRLVKEIKPPFVFLENVPAIRTRGLLEVANAFTEIRYDCRWMCITAASVGAPHKRERWFLLAHTRHDRFGELLQPLEKCGSEKAANPRSNGKAQLVADTNSERLEGQWKEPIRTESKFNDSSHGCSKNVADTNSKRGRSKPRKEQDRSSKIDNGGWWAVEPSVGRVANGVPLRVERIKRLGNAVVPIQARQAFLTLFGLE